MIRTEAALREAVLRLAAAGVPDPGRDARVLLAHVLGGAVALPDSLTQAELDRYQAAIDRREAREPVSHITGRRSFWRYDFNVTPAVLDPRPETETLIEAALNVDFRTVLDLGTGSGAIFLTLLAERMGATGVGTDISSDALAVARQNAARLAVADRARLVQANWFNGIDGQFDLIVSNPPYIAAQEMAGLAPEVSRFEPHAALTDGGDGLSAYRAIARGAAAYLAPGGTVLVEIGSTQGTSVSAIFASTGFEGIRILQDLDGRDRVVSLRKSR